MDGAVDEQKARALFDGVVYNQLGEPAPAVYIGGEAHYAVPDAGIRLHVAATKVDHQVMAIMQEQLLSQQDDLIDMLMQMMGKSDILTKAALLASIRNLEEVMRSEDSSQWLPWLRMIGFRVVVDVHGDVVELVYPSGPGGDDES